MDLIIKGIMPLLNTGLSPRSTASGMVNVFDAYYNQHDDSGIYTHAALDLDHIYVATAALDNVINKITAHPEFAYVVAQARDASPRFCMWPMYTDLIAFCKCIEMELSLLETSSFISDIHTALQDFYAEMRSLIVARCGGFATQGLAHGVAIYLPTRDIYTPYLTTPFAQNSRWIDLLSMMCNTKAQ